MTYSDAMIQAARNRMVELEANIQATVRELAEIGTRQSALMSSKTRYETELAQLQADVPPDEPSGE